MKYTQLLKKFKEHYSQHKYHTIFEIINARESSYSVIKLVFPDDFRYYTLNLDRHIIFLLALIKLKIVPNNFLLDYHGLIRYRSDTISEQIISTETLHLYDEIIRENGGVFQINNEKCGQILFDSPIPLTMELKYRLAVDALLPSELNNPYDNVYRNLVMLSDLMFQINQNESKKYV